LPLIKKTPGSTTIWQKIRTAISPMKVPATQTSDFTKLTSSLDKAKTSMTPYVKPKFDLLKLRNVLGWLWWATAWATLLAQWDKIARENIAKQEAEYYGSQRSVIPWSKTNFVTVQPWQIDYKTRSATPDTTWKKFVVNPWWAMINIPGSTAPKFWTVIPLNKAPGTKAPSTDWSKNTGSKWTGGSKSTWWTLQNIFPSLDNTLDFTGLLDDVKANIPTSTVNPMTAQPKEKKQTYSAQQYPQTPRAYEISKSGPFSWIE
jgi:hypothetical protein